MDAIDPVKRGRWDKKNRDQTLKNRVNTGSRNWLEGSASRKNCTERLRTSEGGATWKPGILGKGRKGDRRKPKP